MIDFVERRRQYLASLGRLIAEHGWALQGVGGGVYGWTYTVGLSDRGHPEMILPVVSFDTAASVLNTIGQACFDEIDVGDPEVLREVLGHPQVFINLRPVHLSWKLTSLFNIARSYYGTVPDAMQVVMADDQGRFPWDNGCALNFDQPVLWEPYEGGWPDDSEED